jgi:hypothetical protein
MLPLLSDTAHAALKVLAPLGTQFTRQQAAEEIVNRIPELGPSEASFEPVWQELLKSKAVVRATPGTEQDLMKLYKVATE